MSHEAKHPDDCTCYRCCSFKCSTCHTNELLCKILEILERVFTARSATLSIGGNTMPADILIGGTATAVLHEFTGAGGTGMEVAPIGPVAYDSSDTTIATVDSVSGAITGVAVGTATINGIDNGNGLTASDTVNVHAATAVSATLVITPAAVTVAGGPKSLPHQKRGK